MLVIFKLIFPHSLRTIPHLRFFLFHLLLHAARPRHPHLCHKYARRFPDYIDSIYLFVYLEFIYLFIFFDVDVKRNARREKRRLAEKALVKAEAEKQAAEAAVAATKPQVRVGSLPPSLPSLRSAL
jgi:hypothetical protein